ncbi:RsfA family transcriptional regulator [Bacillus sp. 165]|uniref:RsfA family transcriptional regulator n=1 Tax=Bacillus sp. 165 TaxID=1529117 RepID=UPI001ADA0870|nr:RsfA family transcriptional regulator [Bacillus sp. 165]MBO9130464.1 RsfA family transcriptional regulator [Bacillus sp. 165]
MKVRQDAWSPEDDFLLAETVLRHIREGSTQLKAFDEVGDHLNRTSAACGFRWNAEVRQNYEEAVQIAKKQRKQLKREEVAKEKNRTPLRQSPKKLIIDAEFSEEMVPKSFELSMDAVISYLQGLQVHDQNINAVQQEHTQLTRENDELRKKNDALEKRIRKLTEQQTAVQEDYETLVRIMERARKLVLLDETDNRIAPIFNTDQNGELEIISK